MRHVLLKGENVKLATTTGEPVEIEIARGLDGGFLLDIPDGSEVELIDFNSQTGELDLRYQPIGGWAVDVDFTIDEDEIEHDHTECEEAISNIEHGDVYGDAAIDYDDSDYRENA